MSSHQPDIRELDPTERFSIALDVRIRPGVAADLEPLEWYGLYWEHRVVMGNAFQRYRRDEMLMLVAEAAEFPVGQVWIDFTSAGQGIARVWALRVIPLLRGMGIGSRLLRAAEHASALRGLRTVELGCEKVNTGARRLYERRGYRCVHEEVEQYRYTRPDGQRIEATSDMWILRKSL